MKRRNFLVLMWQATVGLVVGSATALAQTVPERARTGSTPKKQKGVKRVGPSRTGSARVATPTRAPAAGPPAARPAGARNARGRRTVTRHRTRSRWYRSRRRHRHVFHTRRWRRGRWRHHCFWHHRRWYHGWWAGLFFFTLVAFAAISASSTTHTYGSVTYVHVNPWYRRVLRDDEEGYVLSAVPVGHREDRLPAGSETIEVGGETYFWGDAAFWQGASGGGYVVVDPPVGAEVSSLPKDAAQQTEGDVVVYVYDTLYFTRDTNSSGRTIYRVEPPPAEEEIDSIPPGSPSFVADEETFYYVDYNFYVEFEENGRRGFVNGEPEIGAQVDELPDEVTTVEEGGVTYYQFDTVFFEEVEDENGSLFYEVVEAPDGSAAELEN